MKKITRNQIITILATLLTIVVNGLANGLPLNGKGTGEISDRFDIFFVPAGYVFSIWLLIYLGLAAFTIYQALPAQRESELLKKIYPAYWIGSLANSVWIFLWHYEFFPLTLIAMLTLLASLLYIYRQFPTTGLDQNQKWFVKLTFSIYLGWIKVATIANVTTLLAYWNWSGWGISPEAWAVIMLAIATAVGGLVSFTRGDIAYAAVLIWAFAGIGVKQSSSPIVSTAAWAAAITTAILLIVAVFRRRSKGG